MKGFPHQSLKKNTDQEIKNKEVIEAIHERDLQNPRLDSFKSNFR